MREIRVLKIVVLSNTLLLQMSEGGQLVKIVLMGKHITSVLNYENQNSKVHP